MVVSSTPSRSGIRTHHFEHYEHFSMSFKTVVLLNSSRLHRSVDDYRFHDIAPYRMVIDVGTETRTNRLQTSYKKGMQACNVSKREDIYTFSKRGLCI